MIYYNMSKHINDMSFNELKKELKSCNGTNPMKERIIRDLMVIKYNQHLQKQQQYQQQQQIKAKPTQPITHKPVPDDNDSDEKVRDKTNNSLMERLNNDLEIKNIKPSLKKNIVLPYADTSCDNYATFGSDQGTIKNFKGKQY